MKPQFEIQKIHKESYERFTDQGLEKIVRDFFANIPGLEMTGIEFQPNKYENYCNEKDKKYDEQFCCERNLTFSKMIEITYTVDGQKKARKINLEIPQMTANESFVINGTALYLIPQMVPSPGFFCYQNGNAIIATIRPEKGYELELECSYDATKKPPKLTSSFKFKKVGAKKVFLSLSIDEFMDAFDIVAKDKKENIFWDDLRRKTVTESPKHDKLAKKQEKAVNKVYAKLVPDVKKKSVNTEQKISQIREKFIMSNELTRLGRWQIDRRLKRLGTGRKADLPDRDHYIEKEIETRLTFPDLLGVFRYFYKVLEAEIAPDELEHLDNQKIIRVGDYLSEQLKKRLSKIADDFAKKEQTSQIDIEDFLQQKLGAINIPQMMTPPHNKAGSCRYLFCTNALSDTTEKRRIAKHGGRGVQKGNEFYIPQKRDIHWSYYGRICPIDTPQSDLVGLALTLAIYARIDPLGRVTTPYRKVDKGKVSDAIVWLLASEEEELRDDDSNLKWIAYADRLSADRQLKDTVQARRGKKELIEEIKKADIALIDAGPEQQFSLATNLIPFLRHDDSNRALMAANAMKQALPLKYPEKPLVRTGFEEIAVRESNLTFYAEQSGTITVVDDLTIRRQEDKSSIYNELTTEIGEELYRLNHGLPTLAKSVREQRIAVKNGAAVEPGGLIADCATSDQGQLALGKNLLVAYMPFEGWNFEDAIVISDRLRKKEIFTSLHVYGHEYVITDELFRADLMKIREVLRKELRANVDEEYQKKVEEKGEKEAKAWFNLIISRIYSSREFFYRCIVEDKSEINEPTPFVEVVSRKKKGNRTKQYGIPDEIAFPKLDSKQPIGISGTVDVKVYNDEKELPFKVKQIFRFNIRSEKQIQIGDKLTGRHGNKGVVSRILSEDKMPFFYIEACAEERGNSEGKRVRRYVDLILNPLGVPSRQNLGQIYETHFGWFANTNGGEGIEVPFISEYDLARLIKISEKEPVLKDGKVKLYYFDKNGQEHEIEHPITVGYQYMMKLNHNAASKINVRSYGGYSQTTEQPTHGRRLRGGQRLGEMEVWAMLAHNVPDLLHEMLSVKSDDALGKAKLQARPLVARKVNWKFTNEWRPVLDEGFFFNHNNFPESIRSFIFFIRSLGLSPIFQNADENDVTDEILKHVGISDRSHHAAKGTRIDFDKVTLKIATPEEIESWAFGKKIISKNDLDKEDSFRLTEGDIFSDDLTDYLYELNNLDERNELAPWFTFDSTPTASELQQISLKKLQKSLENNREISPAQILLKRIESLGTHHIGCIDISATPVLNPLFYPLYRDVIKNLKRLAKSKEQAESAAFQEILPDKELREKFPSRSSKDKEFKKKENSPKFIEELLSCIRIEPFVNYLDKKDEPKEDEKQLRNQLQSLRENYNAENLEILLLKQLPVLPPKYRPKQKISGGKIVSLYLTVFYRRILINQVKSTNDRQRTKKWKRISYNVSSLFRNRNVYNPSGQLEKSLQDFLKGKKGIFRRNLLGKRTDYSARAVIVVDPRLDINQCAIPEKMATELYDPLLAGLKSEKIKDPRLKEQFEEIFKYWSPTFPVLLNRNPTLHRMGIMAFDVHRLKREIDDHTISINPLVCQPFNADFDGDQMALFVPMLNRVSEDVQRMMAENHLFSPANGKLIVSISQDIVLGVYLHTKTKDGQKELAEILGSPVTEPLNQNKLIDLIEKKFLFRTENRGKTDLLECLRMIKEIGFRVATQYGVTYSLWDIPSDILSNDQIEETLSDKDNSIAWIFLSGARGSKKQMAKMIGEIGEIDSIDDSRTQRINSNLMKGLSVGEYYYSVYDGRRTQIDQQLATPRAGFLTRKLVYATQGLTIVDEDCGTDDCLTIPKDKFDKYNLLGRFYRTKDGKFEEITQDVLSQLSDKEICIRSPIFCKSEKGICRKCYGQDLSTKELVEIGTPVGIIASQSICERATQASLSARHNLEVNNDLESIIHFFDVKSAEPEMRESVGLVAGSLLSQIFDQLNGKVDIKHFEVVLRLMLQHVLDGKPIILGLTELIRERSGWLLNLAFDRPFSILRRAALEQITDRLEGPLEKLLVSRFGERRGKCRQE